MSAGEPERPLGHLNGVEYSLAIERLRGEMWKEFTRIDGRNELLLARIDLGEKALVLAQTGLDIHLELLNGNTAKLLADQARHSLEIREMVAKLQTIDMAIRDKREIDLRLTKIEEAQNTADVSGANLRGRLWAPLIAAGAIALAVGVAIGNLILK